MAPTSLTGLPAEVFRCPACRTRRKLFTSMIAHIKESGHRLCDCGGGGFYHYPHRPGSPCCTANPMSELQQALRTPGIEPETLEEIELDCVLQNPGKPFNKWRD